MQHRLFSKPTRYILPVVFAAGGFLAAAGVIEARPDLNDNAYEAGAVAVDNDLLIATQ